MTPLRWWAAGFSASMFGVAAVAWFVDSRPLRNWLCAALLATAWLCWIGEEILIRRLRKRASE